MSYLIIHNGDYHNNAEEAKVAPNVSLRRRVVGEFLGCGDRRGFRS